MVYFVSLSTAILVVICRCTLVIAGNALEGSPCSTDNNHIDRFSHKFLDDCDDKTFCSGSVNGTCVVKACRSDEFPFGVKPGDYVPPLCPEGTFCPDEGSGCQPLSAVGAPCQLNKDDQCAPPQNWPELASNQNVNGSLCLNSTCTYANVNLGQACITDNTTYISLGPDNERFTTTVIRHNCRTPQLYCNLYDHVCEPTKPLGFPCSYDQECQSYNCDYSNKCIDPPESPSQVPAWQYGVVITIMFSAAVAALLSLVLVHRRHRLRRYQALRDYCFEQTEFRRSIAALHSAAADTYSREKNV